MNMAKQVTVFTYSRSAMFVDPGHRVETDSCSACVSCILLCCSGVRIGIEC